METYLQNSFLLNHKIVLKSLKVDPRFLELLIKEGFLQIEEVSTMTHL